MKDFLRDDRAQATTEYVLILFIALSMFLILYSKLLKPLIQNMSKKLTDSFNNLLSTGDLHRFPVKH